MKHGNLKMILLTVLLTLCGSVWANACEGLPDEVSKLMEEWEQAGVKTDCTVNQLMAWTVSHAPNKGSVGPITTEGIRLLNAIGYENAQNLQTYSQANFDAWRKKENGVSTAFAGWKGSQATVIYIPEAKQYVLVQYREHPKNESASFNIKVEYDKNSSFSEEERKQIDEAVDWWKDRLKDKFELTVEIIRDPSINAGGTTLVGDVPRSCMDHQPGYAEIRLKSVNPSLVSHEIGHALGIGTASIFKNNNVCSRLAEASKDIPEISVSSARMENGKFFGSLSKGVLMVKDNDGSYGHVSADAKDEDGNASAVQPGLGGKPSLIDLRILEDLGYEIK
ncbi:MAG: hypothetical protein JSS81_17825 [Acidobacteria bacterium]|nr:hypothetical protein [Acidobacteriota bacterium]